MLLSRTHSFCTLYGWRRIVERAFGLHTIIDFLVPQMAYRAFIAQTIEPAWDFKEITAAGIEILGL
jgi:hypothetical protein